MKNKETLKQFVPQEVCLKCQGCCRFKEQDSVWSPCLLDEEILELVDKEGIPPASISSNKRIVPVPCEGIEGFICAFLDAKENKCKMYTMRPFECQLYPFLLNLRDKKIILTVDLNCPYIQEHINTKEFKEYAEYLTAFLNSPKQIKMLKDNPHLLQAYEEVAEIIELNINNEIK